MTWDPTFPRRVPTRRPEGHQPRAPRWSAAYVEPLSEIVSDYIAVQIHDGAESPAEHFIRLAESSADATDSNRPDAFEILSTADRGEFWDLIFVGYWTDPTRHARWSEGSALGRWFRDLDPETIDYGAWRESIVVPASRVETVYSSPEREFGLAACAGIELESTTTNGYFGAARDRMPISAIDTLEPSTDYPRRPRPVPSARRRVRAELGANVCAIRSGQYWESATGEQLEDYESVLEPRLLSGMKHLTDNQDATGTLSLRILRSTGTLDAPPRRETSVVGYFRSLDDLETWAAGHPTHHAIHRHAIEKNRQYGDSRTVTTWHEVFVLSDAHHFEYVNCDPATGVLPYARRLWTISDD